MRRALAIALAGLAVAATPAGAQAPIAGGGSFNDAPVLAPGRYSDTLRGGEQLFYAVTLKPGQKLTAGATIKGRTETSYFMRLQIYNPVRANDNTDGEQTASYGQSDRSVSLRVEGQRVGEENGGSSDLYGEPGTYYVSITADDLGSNVSAEQFDTSIDLQVTGEVIATPTPTATAAPAETAEPSGGTAGLGNSGGGGGDGGGGELGMAIIFGLALGGLVGFGLRRLRTAT